jgi:hypothetical protein
MTRLKTMHTLMAKLFETANPNEYAEYHNVFMALKSKLPDSKTGAWIGSALLWKTLVGLHQDVSDGHQWCGTVNGGEYESDAGLGELCPMILPDVNLAIA